MEKMNMWTLLKESSESWNKDVGVLHTSYHVYILYQIDGSVIDSMCSEMDQGIPQ